MTSPSPGTTTRRQPRPPDPVEKPKRKRRTAQERAADAKRMVEMYENENEKRSIQQIADAFGLSHGTVHRTLVDAGVQMRARGGSNRRAGGHRSTSGGNR